MNVSPYQLRLARRVLAFDDAFGTRLGDRVMSGELKTRHAIQIMALVLVDWENAGRPQNYDASYANKMRVR